MAERWSRTHKVVIAASVAIGLAVRIGWDVGRASSGASGEAANVAVALATKGQFADAFQRGQGPTAHLMPTMPAVAGGVYSLFGVRSTASEIILGGLALLLTFGCYALFGLAAARIGVGRRTCVAAFAVLAMAPIYTSIEAVDFRAWEGGLALALAGVLLLAVLRFDREGVGTGGIVLLACIAAALFFVSPPLGLGGYLMLALFALRRLDARRFGLSVVAAVLALALVVTPWAIRNQRVMGAPILLRDNLGLELAVADHAGAVDPADPRETFEARLMTVHPFPSLAAYHRMRAVGGEVAYAKMMGHEAKAWMAANPGATAKLFARHLVEFITPQAWQFHTARSVWLPRIRALFVSGMTLLGFIGLLRRWREPRARYLMPLVLILPLAYLPFQPIMRYTWLLYPPLAYFAADLTARLFDWRARAGVRASPPSATSVA